MAEMKHEFTIREINSIKRVAAIGGFIASLLFYVILYSIFLREPTTDEDRIQVTTKSIPGSYEIVHDGKAGWIRFKTEKLGTWSWTANQNNYDAAIANVRRGEASFEVYLDYNTKTKERFEKEVRYIEGI